MYCVVHFPLEEKIAVVPQSWISGGSSYWPPYTTQAHVDRAAQSAEKFNRKTWKKYPIRILASYDTFQLAHQHLPDAEYTSDLSDGAVIKSRKRKLKTPEYNTSSSSDDESNSGQDERVVSSLFNPELPDPPSPLSSSVPVQNLVLVGNGTPELDTNTDGSIDTSNFCTTYVLSPVEPQVDALSTPVREIQVPELGSGLTRFIVNSLTKINARLDRIERKLETHQNHNETETDVTELPDFPLSTHDEVEQFENTLTANPAVFKKLVKKLCGIGGITLNERVGSIIDRLITLDVASSYSFRGQKGKRDFSKLRISAAAKEAVMLTLRGVDEKQIESRVGVHLKGIPLRIKRKSAKELEPINFTTTTNPLRASPI